jgi:large subunit ribosomal protein L24
MTPTVTYDYNKDWVFDKHAPWTKMAQIKNAERNKSKIIVPPLRDWYFFRGDKVIEIVFILKKMHLNILKKTNFQFQVQIMSGKDAGRQGIVNAVIRQRNWVFVQGLNTVNI